MASATPAEPATPLTFGPSAPAMRRTLGPVAWAVLECLAEHSGARSEVTVSCRSVRDLADELDLAKDTIARALQRLHRDGLVSRVDERRDDGRFCRGHYVLSLPPGVFMRAIEARPRPARQRPRSRPAGSATQQLALIVDGGDPASR